MGILEDIARAFNPNDNGINNSIQHTNEVLSQTFDPNKNKVNEVMRKTFDPNENKVNEVLSKTFDPNKNKVVDTFKDAFTARLWKCSRQKY